MKIFEILKEGRMTKLRFLRISKRIWSASIFESVLIEDLSELTVGILSGAREKLTPLEFNSKKWQRF